MSNSKLDGELLTYGTRLSGIKERGGGDKIQLLSQPLFLILTAVLKRK